MDYAVRLTTECPAILEHARRIYQRGMLEDWPDPDALLDTAWSASTRRLDDVFDSDEDWTALESAFRSLVPTLTR